MPQWTEVYTGVITVPVLSFHLLPEPLSPLEGSPHSTYLNKSCPAILRGQPRPAAPRSPAFMAPTLAAWEGREKGLPLEQPALALARPQVGAVRGPGLPTSSPELSATSPGLGIPLTLLQVSSSSFLHPLPHQETYPCQAPRQGLGPAQEDAKRPACRQWAAQVARIRHSIHSSPGTWHPLTPPPLVPAPRAVGRILHPGLLTLPKQHPRL